MMQGYLVGNGIADELFDGNALVPFAFGMGLISSEIYEVRFSSSMKDFEPATVEYSVSADLDFPTSLLASLF